MKRLSLLTELKLTGFLLLFTLTFNLDAQMNTGNSGSPVFVRPLTHPQGLKNLPQPSVKSFYQSKDDWQHIIDTTWGMGLPLENKLGIFDTFVSSLLYSFDGFLSLGLDFDSLTTIYRSRIDSSTSRGRFSSIMTQFAMSLRDAHTWAMDTIVTYTPLAPGVPLLILNPFATAEHFGAVLTALPDSTALVLRVVPNHPLGLEPGDIILGYEGVPWKYQVQELIAADLPINSTGVGTISAGINARIRNVGNNWHLFETIDIIKYSSKDTLHLAVAPLIDLPADPMMGNEQLEIQGIPFSFYGGYPSGIGNLVNYGRLPGNNIGYIQLLGEWPGDVADPLLTEAIDSLWNADGIIIDMRWNCGGLDYFDQVFAGIFSQDIYTVSEATRVSPEDFNLVEFPDADIFMIHGTPGCIYDRPLAILLGPTCVSMGEITAQRLRYHPMVRFFGKSSMGSVGSNWPCNLGPDWYANWSISDEFHINQPGVYINRQEFPIDEPVWFTPDEVAAGEDAVVNKAVDWIDNLSHARDVSINHTFIASNPDTVVISATVDNPNQHPLSVLATFHSDSSTVIDSLNLYDDGLHNDGQVDDQVWAVPYVYDNPVKQVVHVSVSTTDPVAGDHRILPEAVLFTNIGPVVLNAPGYRITSSDKEVNPGDLLRFKFTIRNIDPTNPAVNLRSKILCLDTCASLPTVATCTYADLDPGQSTESVNAQQIQFNINSQNGDTAWFALNIYSNEYNFWSDTFAVKIITGIKQITDVTVREFNLKQNYPNPFNPNTTIEFALPKTEWATLKVFNVLGQQVKILVSEKLNPGAYKYEWQASNLPSGIYYYRLQAGEFVQTRKLVYLK